MMNSDIELECKQYPVLIDTATSNVTDTVKKGEQSEGVEVSPDGKRYRKLSHTF